MMGLGWAHHVLFWAPTICIQIPRHIATKTQPCVTLPQTYRYNSRTIRYFAPNSRYETRDIRYRSAAFCPPLLAFLAVPKKARPTHPLPGLSFPGGSRRTQSICRSAKHGAAIAATSKAGGSRAEARWTNHGISAGPYRHPGLTARGEVAGGSEDYELAPSRSFQAYLNANFTQPVGAQSQRQEVPLNPSEACLDKNNESLGNFLADLCSAAKSKLSLLLSRQMLLFHPCNGGTDTKSRLH